MILEPVDRGAYGIVCAALDEDTGENLAIKKIEKAFEHIIFTKRALRELRILRHIRYQNLVGINYLFLPGTEEDLVDVYVVSELIETDLASIPKSSQVISNDHYQILRGMKYVHSAKVAHRDLKPRICW